MYRQRLGHQMSQSESATAKLRPLSVRRGRPGQLNAAKSFGGWGFAPDPTGGAYIAPPDPLAGG